jgi:hypothetical protein
VLDHTPPRAATSGAQPFLDPLQAGHELDAQTLSPLAALAVFDDAGKTGLLGARVKEATDETAAKAFQACKSGAHGDFGGDLSLLVQQAERLARWLENPA